MLWQQNAWPGWYNDKDWPDHNNRGGKDKGRGKDSETDCKGKECKNKGRGKGRGKVEGKPGSKNADGIRENDGDEHSKDSIKAEGNSLGRGAANNRWMAILQDMVGEATRHNQRVVGDLAELKAGYRELQKSHAEIAANLVELKAIGQKLATSSSVATLTVGDEVREVDQSSASDLQCVHEITCSSCFYDRGVHKTVDTCFEYGDQGYRECINAKAWVTTGKNPVKVSCKDCALNGGYWAPGPELPEASLGSSCSCVQEWRQKNAVPGQRCMYLDESKYVKISAMDI